MAHNVGISFSEKQAEEVAMLYLLMQPSSFGSNCCCIATETYMFHGLWMFFPMVSIPSGFGWIIQLFHRYLGVYLSVFFFFPFFFSKKLTG